MWVFDLPYQLSGQMVCLQQKSEADDHEHKSLAQAVVEEGENRSSEQLLEVIRWNFTIIHGANLSSEQLLEIVTYNITWEINDYYIIILKPHKTFLTNFLTMFI